MQSLTHQIVNELGLAVVQGKYTEDNPFPIEAELCEQFNVSRSVLREAVKMLTSKGLLRARPRQGTWVQPEEHWNLLDPDVMRWMLARNFSLHLLSDFVEIRRAIEPEAAAMAARRATPDQLAAIRLALSRMEVAERGQDDPLASDIAFHVAILKASGNRFFARMRDMVESALIISFRISNRLKGGLRADVEEHRDILTAIEQKNPDAAHQASLVLIAKTEQFLKQAQESAQQNTL